MEGNQDSSAVKVLVDVLSASLQNLSDKINSINPILNNVNNNLDKQIAEINKIIFDTQSISKLLDVSVGDFYKRTDDIIENIKLIKLKLESLSTIDSNIEKSKQETKTYIDSLNTSINTLNTTLTQALNQLSKDINPVSRLSHWLTKPIGIIAFAISLILASMAIVNGFNSVLEYFGTTKHNTTQVYQNGTLEKHLPNESMR